MPYTGNPGTVPSDEVRFLLGDVAEPYKLSDDEITYLLAERMNRPGPAAYDGARVLMARYSSMVNKSVGGTITDFGQLVRQYEALSKALARKYLVGSPQVVTDLTQPLHNGVSWGPSDDDVTDYGA